MPDSLSSRFRTTHAAAALSIAAAVALLVLCAPASARVRKTVCRSSSTTHLKHAGHACAHPKGRGRAHHKAKARHTKHPGKKHKTKAPAAATRPALCEDNTRPLHAPDGTFSCGDGSEPACANGSDPTLSSNHATLVCKAGAATVEAICEDGSIPVKEHDGSFACADGTVPGCPTGTEMDLSSDHSALVCKISHEGPAAGPFEPACEDGTGPLHAGTGAFSCDDGSEPTCQDGSEPSLSSNQSTLVCAVAGNEQEEPG